jgi:hypothetical protein
LGFSVMRLVVLLCLASGALLDAAEETCPGKGGNEQTLLRRARGQERPDWTSPQEYAGVLDSLTVRKLHVGGKILVTTSLCPKDTPKGMLKTLYWRHWNVQLDVRNIKTTLGMESVGMRAAVPAMTAWSSTGCCCSSPSRGLASDRGASSPVSASAGPSRSPC